jgi:hypothetical protein
VSEKYLVQPLIAVDAFGKSLESVLSAVKAKLGIE